jgi:hypothetical protein
VKKKEKRVRSRLKLVSRFQHQGCLCFALKPSNAKMLFVEVPFTNMASYTVQECISSMGKNRGVEL